MENDEFSDNILSVALFVFALYRIVASITLPLQASIVTVRLPKFKKVTILLLYSKLMTSSFKNSFGRLSNSNDSLLRIFTRSSKPLTELLLSCPMVKVLFQWNHSKYIVYWNTTGFKFSLVATVLGNRWQNIILPIIRFQCTVFDISNLFIRILYMGTTGTQETEILRNITNWKNKEHIWNYDAEMF